MIWVEFVRSPLPDAQVWLGRHVLALMDAIAWPVAWATLAVRLPMAGGVVGYCALALYAVAALLRANRAVTHNHRYHFTTLRWGRRLAVVVVLGYALKAATLMLSA